MKETELEQTESGQAHPAVTVVVAAYNCERYVRECLQSLREQTFGDFEAIVVDDASTDSTVHVVRAFLDETGDTRFTLVLSERNAGPGAARNKALDRAAGEYVMYVDSDDRLARNALEMLVSRARRQQLEELVYSARSFHEDAAAKALMDEDYSGREPFDGVGTGIELLTFHSERGQYYASGALRMVSRDLLEREHIRFTEGIIHEDELYSFFIAVHSKRSSFLDEPLYLRRQRVGSIMGSQFRSAKSAVGILTSICVVRRWVAANAATLDDAFLRSVGRIVAQWSLVVAREWNQNLSESERALIADELFADERDELFFSILGPGDVMLQAESEYRDSLTYRVGDAIVKVPREVRNRLSVVKNRRAVQDL